ncbi:hypothetical protein [Enterobacter phage vB_ExiM_F5M1E]|nr:hypothetical protein [Enterobacter phage vB_ExiM_F1M1E]UNA03114.1 hypothetical protein [Enterobacter phage vB_ExiM_F2M1E]UNA03435.1 hypothetical protein [Enterobacter phage vB_ExiM_F4M1E]UNA03756.1 hypothetical protein [Enterobacter phage vB_ExiM_F5M1E]UNA04076.1 hypothetical protein [Pantoea phage vB_PdiM_F5M2A]
MRIIIVYAKRKKNYFSLDTKSEFCQANTTLSAVL